MKFSKLCSRDFQVILRISEYEKKGYPKFFHRLESHFHIKLDIGMKITKDKTKYHNTTTYSSYHKLHMIHKWNCNRYIQCLASLTK